MTNTESLVSKEIAKLACQNGFDWPTLYYTGFVSPLEKADHSGNSQYSVDGKMTSYNTIYGGKRIFDMPSQSLLQKWLREKHGLIMWVYPFEVSASDTTGVRYSWAITELNGSILDEGNDSLGYLTYEYAMNAGLTAGLNWVEKLKK